MKSYPCKCPHCGKHYKRLNTPLRPYNGKLPARRYCEKCNFKLFGRAYDHVRGYMQPDYDAIVLYETGRYGWEDGTLDGLG